MASRSSHRRSCRPRSAGSFVASWARPALWSIAVGAISVIGCAQYPVHNLYHATAISYVPANSALYPRTSTPSVVQPFAHGYHITRWHVWADEWGEEIEMLPDATHDLMPAPPTSAPHIAPIPPAAKPAEDDEGQK